PALSGLREARCDRRAAPGIATHIGTHHGLDHHRLRPAVAVARVSEAHPGPGRPGALWMADGGWRTWRGSRMRPSALSGLREARASRWRGRGDGPGLVALQARGGAMRPSALSGLREADGGFHPWCAAAAALRRRHAFNTVARVSEAHPGPGCLGEPGVGVPSCVAEAPDAASGLIRATRSGWRI